MGFWDADEFLIPLDPGFTSLPDFLTAFESVGGLAVSWRVVGPSGHVSRPQGGVLASYRTCTPWDYEDNAEIKSIVNVEHALHPTSDPHSFVYKEGFHAVDAEGNVAQGTRNPAVHAAWRERGTPPRLALYHYVTKSEEEYRDKMRRGSAMGNRKDEGYFRRIAAAATVPCSEALAACARLGLLECLAAVEAERHIGRDAVR